MKIDTITFHRSINYGARLQTYALQQALIKCGYESEVIDYALRGPRIYQKINYKKPGAALKKLAINLNTFINRRNICQVVQKFEAFSREYIRLTEKYDSYEQLNHSPPKADIYMAGSDQLWNIITYGYRPEYFMEFAPTNIKKSTYAVSIANYNYSDEQISIIKNAIKDIPMLSVREEEARDFLLKHFNRESQVHMDSVFLLSPEQWDQIAIVPEIKEKYVFCYALTRNKIMQQVIDELKKKTDYTIVVLSNRSLKMVKGDRYIFNAGPREFLGWISHAEYVLTTSYHGTAFSIIYNKAFGNYTIPEYSSRTDSLLHKFSLMHRKNISATDLLNEAVDYVDIKPKLKAEIANSYDYIRKIGL
jgi:hypothetical protein